MKPFTPDPYVHMDFPSEIFRVLKEKDIRLYGEYRTRRLVLEEWDEQEGKWKKLEVESERGINR